MLFRFNYILGELSLSWETDRGKQKNRFVMTAYFTKQLKKRNESWTK